MVFRSKQWQRHHKPSPHPLQPKQCPLLQLPVELLLLILTYLPEEDALASLALACHHFFFLIGPSIFKKFDRHSPPSSVPRAQIYLYFLRGLQRDRKPDPSIYLCNACLRFHNLHDPKYHLLRIGTHSYNPAPAAGFPVCSPYMEVVREAQDMVLRDRTPTKKNASRIQAWKGRISTPDNMSFTIDIGRGRKDVFLFTSFKIEPKRADPRELEKSFMIPKVYLEESNLEICPHVYFAPDRRGRIGEALDRHYKRQQRDCRLALVMGQTWQPQPLEGFLCRECWVEVAIRFQRTSFAITVWRHVGALKRGKGSWPVEFGRALMKPFLDLGYRARVSRREGGLKAGDLKEEWGEIQFGRRGIRN